MKPKRGSFACETCSVEFPVLYRVHGRGVKENGSYFFVKSGDNL